MLSSTSSAWRPQSTPIGTTLPDRQGIVPLPLPTFPQRRHATTNSTQGESHPTTRPSIIQRLPRVETAAVLATKQLRLSPDSAVLEIWEGTVVECDWGARVMEVLLDAKMSEMPRHTGQIELQWVTDQDMDLVRPGAVFYLTLFKQTQRGTIHNAQELRFRRRPSWSKEQLERMRRDAATIGRKARARPVFS